MDPKVTQALKELRDWCKKYQAHIGMSADRPGRIRVAFSGKDLRFFTLEQFNEWTSYVNEDEVWRF